MPYTSQPPPLYTTRLPAAALSEEKSQPQLFQPLPFYYLEVSRALFRQQPTETFGGNEQFAEVRCYTHHMWSCVHAYQTQGS